MPPRPVRFALLLSLGFSLALTGCKGGEKKAAPSAPPVLTVSTLPAAKREMIATMELTGQVSAWDQLPVHAAANGLRLMAVLAEEGQRVAKGQLLAQLDDATQQAQVAAARARAQSAQAQLSKMRHPNRPQDMVSFAAALSQAEANLKSAQDAYDRFQQLKLEGGVSEAEIVTRESSLLAARAAAEQAKARLNMAHEGSRSEDLTMAQAQYSESRAALQQAEAVLSQTRVVAPDDGLVIRRDAHLGDVSTVGKPLFTLVRQNRLEVDASISESDMGRLAVGQMATIASDARPDMHATGRIRAISPALDATTRQGLVEIALPKNTRFKVGMFVRAQVTLGRHESLAVPAKAVLSKEATNQIFVLEGNQARSRAVQVGTRHGEWVEILSGLKAGEPVVINGVGFLKDGDKVSVQPSLSQASAKD